MNSYSCLGIQRKEYTIFKVPSPNPSQIVMHHQRNADNVQRLKCKYK